MDTKQGTKKDTKKDTKKVAVKVITQDTNSVAAQGTMPVIMTDIVQQVVVLQMTSSRNLMTNILHRHKTNERR